MMRFVGFFALFLVGHFASMAQAYTTDSKKAIKAYEAGITCTKIRDMQCAKQQMLKALDTDPDFLEARLVLAEIYSDEGLTSLAIEAYEGVLSRNRTFFSNTLYQLAELKLLTGEFIEADELYAEFLEKTPSHNPLRGPAQLGRDNASFAQLAVKSPVPFEPVNLGAGVNTAEPEYYPCLTADNNTLMFTRLVPDERASQGVQEDFYVSTDQDGSWSTAERVRTVSTARNEGAGTLSADGRFLIYTACEVFGDYGGGRRGYGSCDLFISIKVGDKWTPAQNLGSAINSRHWESQPSLGSDGRTLYFIRGITLEDGRRLQNIFVSRMSDSGEWSKPEKLGPNVNTPFIEESVQIHPDGQTLYFSSNGHPGMGGLDIYLSRKQEDGTWGPAINLGYPINTGADENSVLISADGDLAFFGSDREGGFGDLDLYSFETHAGMKPLPVSYVKGKVIDKHTKAPLEADIALLDLSNGERIAGSYSDPRTGEFLVCLPAGMDYALNASTEGYMFYSENYSFSGVTTIDKPYELIVEMRPLKSGETITLRNVFFETASAELLPASTVELDRLVTLLKSAPDLRVELGGHTDNVGGESDNQKLSQARAEAVRAYVLEAGIDESRIEAKGYGEEKPVADNETEEGRAKNRRTEVKVL